MQPMYKRISEDSGKNLQAKLQAFEQDSALGTCSIFCVNCGSTRLDQNSLYELKCYNCNQGTFWNSLRFGVARQISSIADVRNALTNFRDSSYDEWHQQIEERLGHFLQLLLSDALQPGNFNRERLEILEREWTHLKKGIDVYFKDRREYDDELL